MKGIFLSLPLVTSLLAGAAFGQDSVGLPTPLTLDQAIVVALQRQPDAVGAAASREASRQRVKQQKARYYPSFTPGYSYGNHYSYGDVQTFGTSGTEIGRGSTTNLTHQSALNYSWTLLDSGRRELNARQSRQNLRASQYDEVNTRQTIIQNVATAYYNVLRDDALVKVSEAQVTRTQNSLAVVQAQVTVGTAPPKDVFQAKADLLNAEVSLLQARNNRANSYTSLKQAMGVPEAEDPTLAPVTPPTEATPLTALEDADVANLSERDALKRLTDKAISLRPDLAQSRASLESSDTSVALARTYAGLTFNADISGGYQYNQWNDYSRAANNDRSINATLSYPLFDGGSTRAQVDESKANRDASKARLDSQLNQVRADVEQAWRTLQQARATIPSSAAAREAAQVNYNAALASRKEGVGSLTDVITAESQLVQAETNYVQAVYDFYSADARLARALGLAERIGTPGSVSGNQKGAVPPTNQDNTPPVQSKGQEKKP